MMESVLNVNIFWVHGPNSVRETIQRKPLWKYFCIVLSGGPRGGSRGPAPTPPPPLWIFPFFLLFHFSEWIERVISCLIQTSPVTEKEIVCSATSHAEVNKASLEEVYIFTSKIKAWAGFDRQHNFVVPVSMKGEMSLGLRFDLFQDLSSEGRVSYL